MLDNCKSLHPAAGKPPSKGEGCMSVLRQSSAGPILRVHGWLRWTSNGPLILAQVMSSVSWDRAPHQSLCSARSLQSLCSARSLVEDSFAISLCPSSNSLSQISKHLKKRKKELILPCIGFNSSLINKIIKVNEWSRKCCSYICPSPNGKVLLLLRKQED